MNILYIGQYTEGTTSHMRANQLKQILKNECSIRSSHPTPLSFDIIDTHIPFHRCPHLWRSIGFRYKRGPLIRRINNYIRHQINTLKIGDAKSINTKYYHLIWVDKAIFLTSKTTQYIRSLTNNLVHFTPDPAFTFHQSHLFTKSLSLYDFAITTKQYELDFYYQILDKEKILYATQGFDKKLHKPLINFAHKKTGVLFIGHHEEQREHVVKELIKREIPVTIAGIKWLNFAQQYVDNKFLVYLGKGIYGNDYVQNLSTYQFSWGALSKWIPELHTTRTFEIPACGTALITERNSETESFFDNNEAIFYDSLDEMIEQIKYYQAQPDKLKQLTQNGMKRVNVDGRDYESILQKKLQQIGIIPLKKTE